MTRGDLLFFEKDLSALIRNYEPAIGEEVARWERNRILASSESDLVSYLVEKYTLDAPRILRDQLHIESEGEAKIDVSGRFEYGIRGRGQPFHVAGSFVTVAIPFEGDGDLFEFRASTYSSNPPRGRVSASSVLISFRAVETNADRTREEIDATVERIEQHLVWIRNDCAGWNARVSSIAEQCVRDRKERLLKQANMVSALGLPMKRRAESAVVSAVPVTREKTSDCIASCSEGGLQARTRIARFRVRVHSRSDRPYVSKYRAQSEYLRADEGRANPRHYPGQPERALRRKCDRRNLQCRGQDGHFDTRRRSQCLHCGM